jgi:hypothetical protein
MGNLRESRQPQAAKEGPAPLNWGERRNSMSFSLWLRNRTSTRPRLGRAQHRPAAPRFRPRLEALEGRWLPSTLTVTSNMDSGPGSLRAEIAAAKSGDTIVFASSLNGKTIALTRGGELSITKGLTIKGPGAGQLTVSGPNTFSSQLFRVFEVNASQPVVLSGLTISNGHVGALGFAGVGAGIFNHTRLIVSACNIANNGGNAGGGIYSLGTLAASGCTFTGNAARGSGGGIVVGNASLTNCTFSNNSAIAGGGVFVAGTTATTTLTNCTLSLNAAALGGGIYVKSPGILNLTNTIVAGNTARSSVGPDIFGAVATADHNLVGDATGSSGIVNGVNGNIVGGNGNPVIDARLGPLQNNGGPTQTMALLAGSPAIGHADNSKAPAKDQRGLPRIDEAGELTDIGAFEL